MSDLTNPDNNGQIISNPATQTLFRFVSLRNPQLAERTGNKKFIFRDEDLNKGIFDSLFDTDEWASSGKTKIDFLTDKVKSNGVSLSSIYRTEAKLIEDFSALYDSSKTLIANGSLTFTIENPAPNVTVPNLTKLWDSLIYQVLTQEDFYVKEIITQMLQTLHYADNYNTFSAEVDSKKKKVKEKEVSTAKVVLPESLFIDSVPVGTHANPYTVGSSPVGSTDYIIGGETNNNVSGGDSDTAYFPTEANLKRQKTAVASYEKSQLETLKKDLTKAEKIYRKQYSKSYDLASKDYQDLVKPLYEAYDAQLLQVEATFTEEMTDAAKRLALSQVAKPEVPDFEFEFRQERDTTFLQAKLSQDSLTSFAKLIGEYVPAEDMAGISNGNVPQENILEIGENQFILPEDENLSFGEMLSTIDEKLSALNEEIYQNTEVEKQEYVSVGGVLIPINNKLANKTGDLSFDGVTTVKGITWGVMLTFKDKSLSIVSGNYKAQVSNATVSDDSIIKSASGVYLLFDGNNVLPVNSFKNGFTVTGTFILSDGKTYTISFTLTRAQPLTNNTNENGYLTGGSALQLEVTDTPDTPDTPGNPNTPNTPTATVTTNNTYIPKGFGIKRLGIADYLKVEQSTHAYVEGEVAAIENIMAREYREKSTRRLRRSEVTETSSSDTEREQLTDTTTSTRFEMQSEVAKILQEATDVGISANTSYSNDTKFGNFSAQLGASYASHRNKEESMRQAVTQAQDVTARALDRVVTKVHQERIEKIVEEFEENNSHGFDNRKGDKHVVGVYRWVDKLMKNQVWNYGKRLMFEFAVPQPAKLHTLAMAELTDKKTIEKPNDPRTSAEFKMTDYTALATENILKHWTSVFNFDYDSKPAQTIFTSHSFSDKNQGIDEEGTGRWTGVYNNNDFKVPEGYLATYITGTLNVGQGTYPKGHISATSHVYICGKESGSKVNMDLESIKDQITISSVTWDIKGISGSLVATCELSAEATKQWQQKTFNAIIQAYEDAMTEYNSKIAEEDAKADNIKGANPLFYRQIEQEVLKHNSIAYLVNDSASKNKVLGKTLYNGDTVAQFEISKTGLDDYASLAKFMEQAFEWDIMSYNLYPYYWGKREDWDDMYQSENVDPLFRSFLRSGMARVVVTVRPGFEDAVQFYMSTGRLWSGGEVPVIGDPLYLSIVDELKDVKGEEQGKPWITRIPTSLTILQAQSIGLKVQHALPFTEEDPLDFENPEEVITKSNFIPVDSMMEAEKSKLVENIEINNDYLQLTNNENPHQVIAQLSLEDLKEALE